MKMQERFNNITARYDQMVARISPQPSTDVLLSPAKREWAMQEGFRPEYNPNTDDVTWVKSPEPAYQQSHIKNIQGSMSPERLTESFPAFAYKAANLDETLQEIIRQAVSGEITTQRAKELAYQFALDTFDEAWKEGAPTGAAKAAASFEQAIEKTTKTAKVAG
ncbi:UNVERIFIED_ORG: hypothetical protein J2Y78_002042 [Buttiauxella agrestis ATCC 33320]